MADIASELIEEIRTKFQTAMVKDRELNQALEAIRKGSTSCNDALTYADEIGAALQKAVSEVLSADVLPDGVMHYNIAKRLINEVYGDAFDLAEDASEQVMKSINDSAGIGLKALAAGTKKGRMSELVESIAGKEYSGRTVTDFLNATRSCPMTAAADTFAANADFQSSVGRAPKIVRTAHAGACEDCVGLAKSYDYPGVSKRVFWRHGSCRCTVEYCPGDGTKQNAHAKEWTRADEADKIEGRKTQAFSGKVEIDAKQFGKKTGKHAADFGLNPASKEDRTAMLNIVETIVGSPDEVRRGEWRGQIGLCDFYIKGSDVVVTNNGKFVTVLKDGALNSGRIKNARKR